jgi:hypothetical protein
MAKVNGTSDRSESSVFSNSKESISIYVRKSEIKESFSFAMLKFTEKY